MPDDRDDRLRMYREGCGLDDTPPPHLDPNPEIRRQAITDCGICDDGYLPSGVVCDHVDRTDTRRRGMAQVRQVLADIAARKARR